MKPAKEIKAKIKELYDELETLKYDFINPRNSTRKLVLKEQILLLKWVLRKSKKKADSAKSAN